MLFAVELDQKYSTTFVIAKQKKTVGKASMSSRKSKKYNFVKLFFTFEIV